MKSFAPSLRPFAVKFLCKDRVIEGADPAKSVSFFFVHLKMYEMNDVIAVPSGLAYSSPSLFSLR
jgi:hypothetical protein